MDGVSTGVMAEGIVTELTTGLTGFGNTLLENFVDILPALAGIAAILFVVNIVRKKVRA